MNKFESDNLYRNIARFYDLRKEYDEWGDVEFFLNQAHAVGGPILDIACGTGRVTLPLAKAGYEVCGIDLSSEMLAILEEKRKYLTKVVNKRLTIIKADMRDFNLGKEFPLIVISGGSFHLLPAKDEQIACLHSVYKHLKFNGTFIVSVGRGNAPLKTSWVREGEISRGSVTDPETGRKIRRAVIRRYADVKSQVFVVDQVWYVTQANGSEKRFADTLIQAIFSRQQMHDLLKSTGFEVFEEHGGYAGEAVGEGKHLVFLCRHK